jgi:hypothetical protein
VIPILRCYFDNHQVWIANGKTKIWEVKEKYQTLMSDLVKWSAWPDGTNWFPMGITEASSGVSNGTNIWYNGLVDLAMYILNPTRVINTRMIDDPKAIPRGPRSDIKVTGDVNQAIGYMRNPEMPGQLFEVGQVLQRFHGLATAQSASVRDAQAGLVRGGVNALENLLSTTTGRQFLAAMVLKCNGFKPAIEKVLIKKQLLAESGDEQFVTVYNDSKTGDIAYMKNTVTIDDWRNIFKVKLSLPVERMNSSAALMERTTFFDRAERRPWMFKWKNMYEELVEDEDLISRVMQPDDVIAENERREAEARLKAIESQSEEQTAQVPGQQEQALAGAANMGA